MWQLVWPMHREPSGLLGGEHGVQLLCPACVWKSTPSAHVVHVASLGAAVMVPDAHSTQERSLALVHGTTARQPLGHVVQACLTPARQKEDPVQACSPVLRTPWPSGVL